jgi:hypothetical protein
VGSRRSSHHTPSQRTPLFPPPLFPPCWTSSPALQDRPLTVLGPSELRGLLPPPCGPMASSNVPNRCAASSYQGVLLGHQIILSFPGRAHMPRQLHPHVLGIWRSGDTGMHGRLRMCLNATAAASKLLGQTLTCTVPAPHHACPKPSPTLCFL